EARSNVAARAPVALLQAQATSAGLPCRSQRRLRRAPWTMSALRAGALMASPSCKSMARTVLLSKRVLKSPFGSFSWAPFGNVSLTAFLRVSPMQTMPSWDQTATRSEEHTSELQSPYDLVCRLLLEKKKNEHITWLRITSHRRLT